MTTADPEVHKLEMRRRLRRYMGTVLLYLLIAFTAPFLVGAVLKVAGVAEAKAATAALLVGAVGMLSVVGLSWRQVFRLWRCPACNGNIIWLVSWNTSAFASRASKTCPHCGVELFDKRSAKRIVRLMLIMVALGAIGGFASSFMSRRAHTQQQQQQAP